MSDEEKKAIHWLENPKKKFDLCKKCYSDFIKAMNKKKEE